LKVPTKIRPQVEELVRLLLKLQVPTATVEDSAEGTIRLYDYISQLINEPLPPEEWEDFDTTEMAQSADVDMSSPSAYGGGGEAEDESDQGQSAQSEEQEMPYESPQQVGYRGEFKPELVQLLAKMREGQKSDEAESPAEPVSAEALRELLEKSVEIEMEQISEGEITDSTGLFVDNLMGQIEQEQLQKEPGKGHDFDTTPPEGGPLHTEQPLTFLYDEWDFRANDYKPNWCCVKQRTMEEGGTDFYDKTLEEYSVLQAQIKRQFELLAPEQFRKVRRLPDGDDLEYDAVVESMVEKRTGNTPSEKIYWRRNKVQRDVAVVFLLDMSASTAEAIDDARKATDDWSPPDDPREYLAWLRARREEGTRRSYKRIIDVEKESAILLIRALETIGDAYGIYGFSGYGRENVEFYVIKDIDEALSDRVKRRIDKINPLHATRMGPAIRHAISKLEKQEARTKVLFLLSDGRPQDRGYSREGVEKEYAVHDTKKALQEARRAQIVPFCLTVDRGGHDYLKTMCQDMGYEVVSEIESLPRRLPYLYRRLTV
ncbi:MAG: VWA domain-containing protein, partial [Dehalococcoidia bacterium]